MTATPCYVGIAVAQARLDVATRPGGDRWHVANAAPAWPRSSPGYTNCRRR